MRKKQIEQPESQKWFVVRSEPTIDFLEKKHGLTNTSKNRLTKEYRVSDKRHINIDTSGNMFLFDVVIPGIVVDTMPEKSTINKPSMIYRGGVISEKRLSAFIAGE